MSIIRYICISDLHLGIETSLLTNVSKDQEINFNNPSPVLTALSRCLRSLINNSSICFESNYYTNVVKSSEAAVNDQDLAEEGSCYHSDNKPVLILCGDTLEFSLATDNYAAMAFRQFIEQVLPEGSELFSEIIYIPGNHDHHIWESARETQYANYIESLEIGDRIKPPWFTTRLFLNENTAPVPAGLPASIINVFPHLHYYGSKRKRFPVRTAYPNLGLLNPENRKCVIFHHGHYTESIYTMMSRINALAFPNQKFPDQIWDLEADNHAWIDFFWSMLGRSGKTGRDISLIYNERDNDEFINELIKTLSDNLAGIIEKQAEMDLPSFMESTAYFFDAIKNGLRVDEIQKAVLSLVLQHFIKLGAHKILATEKDDKDLLSESSKAELVNYLNVYVYNQLVDQIKFLNKHMPEELIFVFGHTHKPFEDMIKVNRYPRDISIYNTGGWVTEGSEANPLVGGAVLCLDDELTPVSIRMYNNHSNDEDFTIKVEEVLQQNEEHSLFYDEISNAINSETGIWKDFSRAVAEEIESRRKAHRSVAASIPRIESSTP